MDALDEVAQMNHLFVDWYCCNLCGGVSLIVIHHEQDVREEQIYMRGASKQ